ncbi:Adenylate cyclase [Dissulfuribacter thermophilus]|uniref:Adenylate cyclase n=1 Tax=Dissulfuribacter thermophilus TaxID=1156395 RepID=A0A1B9F5G9_9BACT|nr:CHASE2 domain-containing protein [Dissulfuribacter thermophilus]OCC15166.1 Adenylate cyclase [Dissulfuribacter thermophilus]
MAIQLTHWSLKRLIYLKIGILVPIITLIFAPTTKLGEITNLAWIDLLFTLRGIKSPPRDIVIVAIDEPSFQYLGRQWPWPRSLHGRLVRKLKKAGAKVIAFDIMFTEPSRYPNDDKTFAQDLAYAGNVILGASITQVQREGYTQIFFTDPLEILSRASAQTGLVNFFPDPDGIIRHGRLFISEYPSLAYATYFQQKKSIKNRSTNYNPEKNPFLIDFSGPSGVIKTVSYYQALNMEEFLPKNFFKDKIVFVGFASEAAVEVSRGAVDAFPTPFFRFSKKAMFGVEIHANALNTILSGFPLREIDFKWLKFIYALIALVPLFVRRYPLMLTGTVAALICTMIFTSVSLFFYKGLVLNIGVALLATIFGGLWWGLSGYLLTFEEKKEIRRAFDRYVPRAVIEEILKNPQLLHLGGHKTELTVLFADIRGFTSLSETLDPEQLVYLLNNYLDHMTERVFKNHGLLDKYIGDAIMAVFGAPVPRDDHAYRACKTALEMLSCLEMVGSIWEKRGLKRPKIGIGINTGQMVIGNFGSHRRFDYTVIGDEVNLASRLEGLNKLYGTSIIIGENTQRYVDKKFLFRELDLVRVKGKKLPVRIFELIKEGEADSELTTLLSKFNKALEYYRKGNWSKALEAFQEILTIKPNDGPSKLFFSRCEILLKNPPKTWDGIWTMKTK